MVRNLVGIRRSDDDAGNAANLDMMEIKIGCQIICNTNVLSFDTLVDALW